MFLRKLVVACIITSFVVSNSEDSQKGLCENPKHFQKEGVPKYLGGTVSCQMLQQFYVKDKPCSELIRISKDTSYDVTTLLHMAPECCNCLPTKCTGHLGGNICQNPKQFIRDHSFEFIEGEMTCGHFAVMVGNKDCSDSFFPDTIKDPNIPEAKVSDVLVFGKTCCKDGAMKCEASNSETTESIRMRKGSPSAEVEESGVGDANEYEPQAQRSGYLCKDPQVLAKSNLIPSEIVGSDSVTCEMVAQDFASKSVTCDSELVAGVCTDSDRSTNRIEGLDTEQLCLKNGKYWNPRKSVGQVTRLLSTICCGGRETACGQAYSLCKSPKDFVAHEKPASLPGATCEMLAMEIGEKKCEDKMAEGACVDGDDVRKKHRKRHYELDSQIACTRSGHNWMEGPTVKDVVADVSYLCCGGQVDMCGSQQSDIQSSRVNVKRRSGRGGEL